jgi:hypothetical protein
MARGYDLARAPIIGFANAVLPEISESRRVENPPHT